MWVADAAVQQALQIHTMPQAGDILIFMSGQADIETTCSTLQVILSHGVVDSSFVASQSSLSRRARHAWAPVTLFLPFTPSLISLFQHFPHDASRLALIMLSFPPFPTALSVFLPLILHLPPLQCLTPVRPPDRVHHSNA